MPPPIPVASILGPVTANPKALPAVRAPAALRRPLPTGMGGDAIAAWVAPLGADDDPDSQPDVDIDVWDCSLRRRPLRKQRKNESRREYLDADDVDPPNEVYIELRNAVAILLEDYRLKGRLRYDVLACEKLFSTTDRFGRQVDLPVTDEIETALALWMASSGYKANFPTSMVHEAVEAVTRMNAFDPAQVWGNALDEWDGTERLPDLFTRYFGVDPLGEEDLVRAYGVCFGTALAARMYEPGCKSDSAPILAGPKGWRKSTGFRALAPRPEWFGDSMIKIGDKEAYQVIQGKLLWELPELESLGRSQISAVKAFMASQVDEYRPPYGRNKVKQPRRCTFVGTVNSDSDPAFLREADRRWWPMRLRRPCDTDAIERDREQLWAEGIWRYRERQPWWLTGDLATRQDVSVRAFVGGDPWEEAIAKYVENEPETTTSLLLEHAIGKRPSEFTKSDSMRAAAILGNLGWKQLTPGSTRQRKTQDGKGWEPVRARWWVRA